MSQFESQREANQARLRGWGPLGVLAVAVVIAADLVVKPLSAIAALVWARLSGTLLRELGLVRPRSWPVALIVGVFLGILLKLLLKAVVMPVLGAPATNEAYAFLIGNTAALPGMLYVIVVGAGFGEEIVHRGFLFKRVRSLLRDRWHATAVAVGIIYWNLEAAIAHWVF